MSAALTDVRSSLARRLWIYQAERFPVLKHGLIIAVFALAGVALPSLTSGAQAYDPAAAAVAVAACFIFFLQLRIADEHKDHEDDRRFRPERPVPRGLISLAELRWLGAAATLGQAALAWALDVRLLAYLAAAWLWMALMTAEFFAPRALKTRPALYLASHMVITPLIALFAVACGWVASGAEFRADAAVMAFLALAYANGAAVEIARKTWAPNDERRGVDSYSKTWGPKLAASAMGAAIVIGFGLAGFALYVEGVALWAMGVMVALAFIALAAALSYAHRSTTLRARLLETAVGVWVLGNYSVFAVAPLVAGGAP